MIKQMPQRKSVQWAFVLFTPVFVDLTCKNTYSKTSAFNITMDVLFICLSTGTQMSCLCRIFYPPSVHRNMSQTYLQQCHFLRNSIK